MPRPLDADVVIVGAGLAGLSLARHLLLETERRVILLERRAEIPPPRQKVGESTVQLAGNYLSKVLDLEEVLLREHYMKYNLRFYWKSGGRGNDGLEDYGQAYIRSFSNVASYQLDRNRLEAELLRRNLESERFSLEAPVADLTFELDPEAGHRVTYSRDGGKSELRCGWLVDTTGRARLFAKRMDLQQKNEVRHGTSFCWVEGQVDLEKLTRRSRKEVRLDPARAAVGHLPQWLGTCHFMGEGFWFWVIPLQGKTSLGLVYDNRFFDRARVSSAEKLIDWACQEFPLFARDLPQREILDFGGYRDFSHGCAQTIHPDRWGMVGEAGRFSDPLYSPGSDLIAIYNTLLVDAIETDDEGELRSKCQRYEILQRAVYEAYLPSYGTSYDALGDQECFVLKYSWELAIYFGFYVFPFLNDLFTDRRFLAAYFNRFARLGELNRRLQELLSDYYQWKREHGLEQREPVLYDLMALAPLRRAEETFYRVGVDVDEARSVLDQQLEQLDELARYTFAWIAARVSGEEGLLRSRHPVAALEPAELRFDEALFAELGAASLEAPSDSAGAAWSLDPQALAPFLSRSDPVPSGRP